MFVEQLQKVYFESADKTVCLFRVFIRGMVGWFRFMVLKSTFNNISVISWQSVLLVEETEVPGETH